MTQRLIAYSVLLVSVVGLVVLFWLYLIPSGSVTHRVSFTQEQAMLSRPYPRGRLMGQAWVGEPLYIDVRMPRRLHTAVIRLHYTGASGEPGIGLRLSPDPALPWRYAVIPATRAVGVVADEEVVEAVATFSLDAAHLEDGSIRFLLSWPGVEALESPPVIQLITVTLTGEPLGGRQLYGWARRAYRDLRTYFTYAARS